MYANCVGLVDTGYFKRSGPQGSGQGQGGRGAQGVVPPAHKQSQRAERLMDLLQIVVSASAAGHREDDFVL